MKRFLALLSCAVVLTACLGSNSHAAVDVSFNIVYNNLGDPSLGGNWTLVSKTDTAGSNGIVSLVVRLLGIDPNDPASVHPDIGHDINGGLLKIGFFSGATEYVYGQDPNDGLILQVGLPGSPSNLVNDPLGDNVNWANSSIIATGTIPDLTTLPSFTLIAANESISGIIQGATIGFVAVRTFVPEPATMLLGCVAALGIAFHRRR